MPKPYFTEVESRTQPSRPRTDFSRPRTQGASVLPPKKSSPKFFSGDLQKKKILSKFSARFLPISQVKLKKGHVHGSFLTKQKKCSPRAEDSTFSRTCGLQGQRFQNVSPSRTPFLPLTEVKT